MYGSRAKRGRYGISTVEPTIEAERLTLPAAPKPPPVVVEPGVRPHVRGKFLYVGDQKYWVRGVTYGPFAPGPDGQEYGTRGQVETDFALMARNGINTVRTYTAPPDWLLDVAQANNLRVMIGVPWEQHITFLDDRKRVAAIVDKVGQIVRRFAGHPAVLCYAIGNEVPAPVCRWYGRRRIERFLKRLYLAAKAQDEAGLVTYVNYPTTEYLKLPFLDFQCFNVYLETPERLRAYLSRLQNLAGDRPLVMAELGLDSRRNGQEKQAQVLSWQVRETFACGCAGMFVFAWTDQWHRGGFDIDDWDFGLTGRDRSAKPALEAVSRAYAQTPFPMHGQWPRVSVVVCTYNGSRTIVQTLQALQQLAYRNYEVVVVNDGSRDRVPELIEPFADDPRFNLIHKENGGLSSARNVGVRAATGDIVVYLDDDAYPGPFWLFYVAHHLMTTDHVAVGGPNIPPWGDGMVGEAVANSPGGPNHVLYSDRIAEHIPGCNMAFRKEALLAVGGFDERFRIAGDDVDLCWRLQENGGVIGFHPGATVFHHRRLQLRGYLRQQQNYGRAEAMLEDKWPSKYNKLGHIVWHGRIYGTGLTLPIFLKTQRVYHGVWGSEPYQSSVSRSPGVLQSLPLMPEWYLIIGIMLIVSLPGIFWKPLLFLTPLLALAVGAPLVQAVHTASQAELREMRGWTRRIRCRLLIAALHIAQPIVRLKGRIAGGLMVWQRTQWRWWDWPIIVNQTVWSEKWEAPESKLARLEKAIYELGASCFRGRGFERWDIEIRGGLFGHYRIRTVVEEHGGGKQLMRLRGCPQTGAHVLLLLVLLLGGTVLTLLTASPGLTLFFVGLILALTGITLGECGVAAAYYKIAIAQALGARR